MILSADEVQNLTLNQITDLIEKDAAIQARPEKHLTLKKLPDGSVSIKPQTLLGGGHRKDFSELMRSAALREVGPEAEEAIRGLKINEKVKLADLYQICGQVDIVIAEQKSKQAEEIRLKQAADLNPDIIKAQQDYSALRANPPAPNDARLSSVSVDEMLAHDKTKAFVSTSGANCPLIIKSDLDPNGGALIKAEYTESVTSANIQSSMMADLAEKTKGLGFNVARAVEYIPTNKEKAAILETIQSIKSDANISADQKERVENLEARITSLKTTEDDNDGVSLQDSDMSVTKMDLVDGTQLNHLPLAQKVALIKSPEFAQQLGRLAAIGPMMGLADHMVVNSTSDSSYRNDGSNGQSNVSNFMLSNKDGSVIPIDYASHARSEPNEPLIIGLKHPDTAVMNLAKFVNGTKPEEASQQVLSNLKQNKTPISMAMQAILSPEKNPLHSKDCFFNSDECHVLENDQILSPDEKAAFVQNFILGAKNGLDFIEQNVTEFEQAYAKSAIESGLDPDGERHFMKAEQLQNIVTGLKNMKESVAQGYENYTEKKTEQLNRVTQNNSVDKFRPSPEKSVLGQSAEELIAHLDEQNAKLKGIQTNDKNRLKELDDEAVKEALVQLIEKRASNISANDELKNQLKQGEHPTVVQYQMVKNQVLLINNKDQLEQLKNAAENLQPDHLGPMKERSALGDFPQTIIADLDVQTAKLENIQKRDRARLETSEPGAGKDALQEMINDRATIIADNKKFKERLNQGEHPTLVQLEMAQKSGGLVSVKELEILKNAADKLQANQGVIKANAVAANDVKPDSQRVANIQADKVQLDSLAPKLSKPPPTVLPPLPVDVSKLSKPPQPPQQHNQAVRDIIRPGTVSNNTFKVQDEILKAEQKTAIQSAPVNKEAQKADATEGGPGELETDKETKTLKVHEATGIPPHTSSDSLKQPQNSTLNAVGGRPRK